MLLVYPLTLKSRIFLHLTAAGFVSASVPILKVVDIFLPSIVSATSWSMNVVSLPESRKAYINFSSLGFELDDSQTGTTVVVEVVYVGCPVMVLAEWASFTSADSGFLS